eukprot:15816028-Heterocapsa_arctica.AAC.1
MEDLADSLTTYYIGGANNIGRLRGLISWVRRHFFQYRLELATAHSDSDADERLDRDTAEAVHRSRLETSPPRITGSASSTAPAIHPLRSKSKKGPTDKPDAVTSSHPDSLTIDKKSKDARKSRKGDHTGHN